MASVDSLVQKRRSIVIYPMLILAGLFVLGGRSVTDEWRQQKTDVDNRPCPLENWSRGIGHELAEGTDSGWLDLAGEKPLMLLESCSQLRVDTKKHQADEMEFESQKGSRTIAGR